MKLTCIIVSTREKETKSLLEDLKQQCESDFEIVVIKSRKNASKSRNLGARQAKSDILLFIDDDVIIHDKNWLKKMLNPFEDYLPDKKIGLIGSAFMLPPNSSWLERRIAKEFPRIECLPPEVLTESDLAGANCVAIRREVFDEIGGWDENYITSTDIKLRYDLNKNGYRCYLAPNALILHPRQKTFKELFNKYKWYYYNSALPVKIGDNSLGRKELIKTKDKIIYFLGSILSIIPDIFWNNSKKNLCFSPIYAFVFFYGRLNYLKAWLNKNN